LTNAANATVIPVVRYFVSVSKNIVKDYVTCIRIAYFKKLL